MRCVIQTIKPLFFTALLMATTCSAADLKLPTLDEIDSIYVLGTFDIPDMPADSDGLRDRPRYVLWPEAKRATSTEVGVDTGELQPRVLAMLGSHYKTVGRDDWYNNYHHVVDRVEGGLVLKNGRIIGWILKPGGLGYFDFAYNPRSEKMATWQPLDLTLVAPPDTRGTKIYRVWLCRPE